MLSNKKECSGCAACSSVCPINAIEMKEDSEKFSYPNINRNICISCKKCENICSAPTEFNKDFTGYAAQNENKEELRESTSGGIVSALCKTIISEGGVVYAAAYDVKKGGYWTVIESNDQIRQIRGSKYLQIDLKRKDYDFIRDELKRRKLLFIGTPCQVDGVKKVFSGNESSNLYLIDIICGGVISSKIEQLYLKYLGKSGKELIYRRFRSKVNGIWERTYHSEYHYSDGSMFSFKGAEDLYNRLYMSERLLRESCYNCKYTTNDRVGDITVGDCWGIEKEEFQFPNIEEGVSLVLANNSKGKLLLNRTKGINKTELVNLKPIKENKPLNNHIKRHAMRRISYKLFSIFSFKVAASIICYRYYIKKIISR